MILVPNKGRNTGIRKLVNRLSELSLLWINCEMEKAFWYRYTSDLSIWKPTPLQPGIPLSAHISALGKWRLDYNLYIYTFFFFFFAWHISTYRIYWREHLLLLFYIHTHHQPTLYLTFSLSLFIILKWAEASSRRKVPQERHNALKPNDSTR